MPIGMQVILGIMALTSLLSTTIAAPLNARDTTNVEPDRAHCSTSSISGGALRYNIIVGEPWNNAANCNTAHDLVVSSVGIENVLDFRCILPSDSATTNFVITIPQTSQAVSGMLAGLKKTFPNVEFEPTCSTPDIPHVPATRSTTNIQARDTFPLASLASRVSGVSEGEALCDTTETGPLAYMVVVGEPFNGGARCAAINDTITKHMLIEGIQEIRDFTCEGAPLGNPEAFPDDWRNHPDDSKTFINFKVPRNTDAVTGVMDGLQEAFQGVEFPNDCWTPNTTETSASSRNQARAGGPALNTGSCAIESIRSGEMSEYYITIGRPFNNGAGCSDVETAISEHVGADLSNWFCHPDNIDNPNTYLHLTISPSSATALMDGLEKVYNMVTFDSTCYPAVA